MEKLLRIKDMSISSRNTRLILMMQSCQSAIFFLPVLILYYQTEIGLTFKDFMIIEAIFCATIILMEIPSGWLSDLWSRKHTLAAGLFFTTLGFGWLLMADSFWDAAFAEILTGTGVSLISGTNSAMLYDSLRRIKKPMIIGGSKVCATVAVFMRWLSPVLQAACCIRSTIIFLLL